MNRHLNDSELAFAAAGFDLEPGPTAHLEACISCRRSVDLFLNRVDERRRAIEEEAPNWDEQLDQILGGLSIHSTKPAEKVRRWLGPLLATAATVIIAIGTGLIVQERDPVPVPTPRPDIKIEEILAQTDALLSEEGIPGFEIILDDVSDDDLTALFGALNS